ncbi:MAG: transposase [Thermodesulfobacteriota bacterium]|nr:transposase [Thermodesulfobacteriota bacterium]
MPRLARLDAPGVLHHIIIRGIERRNIFRDDKDRDNFVDRLSDLLPETQTACYAWAFIPNHAHFLFRSGIAGISTLMRRLLTGYAVYFNRRHKRHGQLFQNRFKSIICQEDIYFRELVRYIHLNPMRAKIVSGIKELNKYQYSGHSVIMGKQKHEWQNTEYVLSYFGKKVSESRRGYLSYLGKGIDQGRRLELTGGGLIRSLGGWSAIKKLQLDGQDRVKGDERILGDGEFVTALLSEANEKLERHYKLKALGYDLEKISQVVSEIYDIETEEIYSKGRRKVQVEARDLLCYWAVRELGISCTDLAKHLEMSQPGVGYAVNRGEKITKKHNYHLP